MKNHGKKRGKARRFASFSPHFEVLSSPLAEIYSISRFDFIRRAAGAPVREAQELSEIGDASPLLQL